MRKRPLAAGQRLGPYQVKWALTGLALMLLIGIGVTWLAKRRVQQPPPEPPELREIRLTTNPSEYGVLLGCISPDGKYLAYSDRRGLYLKLIESEEVRAIPQQERLTAENSDWMPAYWFPDGTKFVACRMGATGFSTWLISMLSGPPRLLRDSADPGPPSPDGSRIVYLAGVRAIDGASEIWVMGAQGENPRKVLTAPEVNGSVGQCGPPMASGSLTGEITARARLPSRAATSKANS